MLKGKSKRFISILLVIIMIIAVPLVGCEKKEDTSEDGSKEEKQEIASENKKEDEKPDEKEPEKEQEKSKVVFWYLWGGETGKWVQNRVDHFNESQDKYFVEGLSVPDKQKIIVAISSGSGPDLTDDFSNFVADYAEKGVAEPLDDYIQKDNDEFKIDDFIPMALESCKYDGKTYAIPCSINFMMLFYNKKLFNEAGLEGPPKTDKELLEYAIKLTKVNDDGTIDVLGFPDFPIVYYLGPMSAAFGAQLISEDGKTLTPDNPGTLRALNLIVEYIKKFGYDNVAKFRAAGKYLDATDPFFTDKQAMRIDGMWLGSKVRTELKLSKEDFDYGIAPLPYPEGHPELELGNSISCSMYYIPKNAKNKEGAWEYLKWAMGEEECQVINPVAAGFPTRFSSVNAPIFQEVIDFPEFSVMADSKNLRLFPALSIQNKYNEIIDEEAELVMNLKKSPEEAMKDAAKKANELMKELK